ncbi:MAG: hypothetical protein H6564_20950 [Lewinellaceae bacterium]|nr:hypothetical protein [Lewinellaceae bacterium]
MKLYKVFTAPVQYDPKSRGQLIDILKPFFGKGGGFTDAQRIAQYGLSEHDIQFTADLYTADFAILPMSWNYYHQYEKRALANEFVQKAARAGKKVLSWTSGDFGVRIPHFDNLIVLRVPVVIVPCFRPTIRACRFFSTTL